MSFDFFNALADASLPHDPPVDMFSIKRKIAITVIGVCLSAGVIMFGLWLARRPRLGKSNARFRLEAAAALIVFGLTLGLIIFAIVPLIWGESSAGSEGSRADTQQEAKEQPYRQSQPAASTGGSQPAASNGGSDRDVCIVGSTFGGDNGKTVTLKRGQRLLITLNSNPSTGYQWWVDACDASILRQGDAVYVPDPLPEHLRDGGKMPVGGGGKLTLAFTAIQQGRTMLSMGHRRGKQRGEARSESFGLAVNVE